MAKQKPTTIGKQTQSVEAEDMTRSSLQTYPELWYKIQVLLHDLCNIANDRAAEARTLQTTDELYISAPYFTSEEASRIKALVVRRPILHEIPEFEYLELDETNEENKRALEGEEIPEEVTIEEAIKSCLQNFFEKRKASGDARPCGPHDLGPIYRAIFDVTKEELKDEKFFSRLRRTGLRQSNERPENEGTVIK